MSKIFLTQIKKVYNVVAFVVRPIAAVAVQAKLSLVGAYVKAAVAASQISMRLAAKTNVGIQFVRNLVTLNSKATPAFMASIVRLSATVPTKVAVAMQRNVFTLASFVKPAIAIANRVTATFRVTVNSAYAIANKTVATFARPLKIPAYEIVQTTINLVSTRGVTTMTQSAVAGRSDWATITNAQGLVDGTLATFAGNALGARAGRLDGVYAAPLDKTLLTITKVEMRFYVQTTNITLGNGQGLIGYRINNGADVQLAALTTLQNNLTTPLAYDLTSVVAGSWTTLGQLSAYITVSNPLGNGSGINLDAIHLYVEANRTEIP